MKENEILVKLAKEALAVQDACNLSGVVHSFAQAMTKLGEVARAEGKGTEWKNTHPVAVLFADKVAHLTGTQGDFGCARIDAAYAACERLVKGE